MAPVIDSLKSGSPGDTIEVGNVMTLMCYASDPDTDLISYRWEAAGGRFSPDSTAITHWSPPSQTIPHQILVHVTDAYHKTTASIDVFVVPQNSLNNPPVITSLSVNRDSVTTGGVVRVSCVAYDPDGDRLTYIWSSSGGIFNGSGAEAQWVAPGIVGAYKLRVDVADGFHFVTDTTFVEVVPDTTFLYQANFATNQVTGRWAEAGLLAGLGTNEGSSRVVWDSTGQTMAVTARSNYGTYGFKLNGTTFGEGTFRMIVRSTGTQYSQVAFVPKFIDNRNYIIFGINPIGASWLVIRCVDGVTQYLGQGWDTFPTDQIIEFVYRESGGHAIATVAGRQLWAGAVLAPFNIPVPMGVALSGVGDIPAAKFDDFRVTIP